MTPSLPSFFLKVQLVQNFPFLQMFELDSNVPFPSQIIYFLPQSLSLKVQLRQSSVEMGVRLIEFFYISVLTGAQLQRVLCWIRLGKYWLSKFLSTSSLPCILLGRKPLGFQLAYLKKREPTVLLTIITKESKYESNV